MLLLTRSDHSMSLIKSIFTMYIAKPIRLSPFRNLNTSRPHSLAPGNPCSAQSLGATHSPQPGPSSKIEFSDSAGNYTPSSLGWRTLPRRARRIDRCQRVWERMQIGAHKWIWAWFINMRETTISSRYKSLFLTSFELTTTWKRKWYAREANSSGCVWWFKWARGFFFSGLEFVNYEWEHVNKM